MKKIAGIILGAIISINGFCLEKPIESKIKEVTVFLQGAQVTRAATVPLAAGVYELILKDLPQGINPNSVQVEGKGNFTILSVMHQVNYLNSQQKTAELISLETKLEELSDEISLKQSILTVYQQEEQMLLANKTIGGTENGVNVADLQTAIEYFRTRMTEIKTKILDIQKEIRKLTAEKTKVQNQLNQYKNQLNKPTGEIVVKVSAKAPITAYLEVDYNITNAGWQPVYDLRAEDISKPVKLNYKANVYQASGENWDDVKLTLSTGNPTLGGAKPILSTWWLDFYYRSSGYGGYKESMKKEMVSSRTKGLVASEEMYDEAEMDAFSMDSYVEVNVGQTTVNFDISIPYSIPATGKKYLVDIQKHTLPANYEYHCVPKLDKDAFLMARVTGWEEYNLLSGEMNLYFEGKYVGKSYLNTKSTNDTIDLSLGRDQSIIVTRAKLKDYSEKKVIGTNQKETIGWEIAVRNNKRQKIDIVIEDQVPLTTNKEIEIENIEISGAKLNKNNGKLTWKYEMNSGESKKWKMIYSVKYPKDQNVTLE